jgi:mannosylglucosylglycerate synthase
LVSRLDLPKARLYITHRSDDEGLAYWHWLKREAQVMGVQVQLIDHLIGNERAELKGYKVYSLWDAYPHANLVTFPSLYEGFGNALLESIYFKRLTVVNRYPVYNADIKPLGFQFVEMDGFVDDHTIQETSQLLQDPQRVQEMVELNYQIALEQFSFEVLERKLGELLANSST